MDETIKNLNDIYKKSKYLERPKTIQGDNQFDNKKFRDFCNGYVDGWQNISGNDIQKMIYSILFEADKEGNVANVMKI